MAKVESTTHEVSIHFLAAERRLPYALQIVERTLTENDKRVTKNVTNIHVIRFQKHTDIKKFAEALTQATKRSSILSYNDDPPKNRRKEDKDKNKSELGGIGRR